MMRNWFANLKFRYKLLLGTIGITTLALLCISQLSYAYFYKRNIREVLAKADTSTVMAAKTISDQLNTVAAGSNLMLLKAPFPDLIYEINHGQFSGYSAYFSSISSEFSTFIQSHDIVTGTILCGNDGTFLSQNAIGPKTSLSEMFSEDIWNSDQIRILPARSNFLSQRGMAIPMIYPVFSANRSTQERSVSYQDVAGFCPVRYVILLDAAQIDAYFDQMSNGYTYRMYLADENGYPINIAPEDYPEAFLPEVMTWVADIGKPGQDEPAYSPNDLFLTAKPVKFSNLRIVHMTKKSALTGDIRELRSFFSGIWLVCTLLSCLLAIILSHFLTRKIKTASGIIEQINDQTYKNPEIFPNTDEISLLGRQLNHMYDTIQLQLQQIKEEEKKKARAEIQMMSEQINPHFLYNTLECIHFQILNKNTDTAAAMLESLGRYLRITLSVGSTMIPFQKEVEHVTSYMEIMNRHSNSGIRFTCQLAPELRDYKVLKVILQPLAENSIKHGFNGQVTVDMPVVPQITIRITSTEQETIVIEVSDNGKGIDLAAANACIHDTEANESKHFGLRNIYRRLKACYGDHADMTFTSIPYLKNSVIITIPDMISTQNRAV